MSSGEDPNSGLIYSNEQLRLVNQLLDRKIRNLQAENQGLQERVRSLTTAEDKDRLRLLLADSERRRLTKLRAIVKHHVSVLTSSVREFNAYIEDIDQGIDALAKEGALDPDIIGDMAIRRPPRVIAQLEGALTRIAESPLIHRAEPAPGSNDNAVMAAASVKHEPSNDPTATAAAVVEKRKGGRGEKQPPMAVNLQQPASIVHQSPPKQMRACKKTIVQKADAPAPVKPQPPAAPPASVVQSETPADENRDPKTPVGSPNGAGADSSTLCFEDALSYTIVGSQSFGVGAEIGGGSDAMLPPMYTSTPKAPPAAALKAGRDREGFLPPAAVGASAKPTASKRQPKPRAAVAKPTAKTSGKRSAPKEKIANGATLTAPPTATPTNRSEGDSGFILDPTATVNVTARRRTSCSYAEPADEGNDSGDQSTTVAGDLTVVSGAPAIGPVRSVVEAAAPSRPPSAAGSGPSRKRQKRMSDSDNPDDSTFVVSTSPKRRRGAGRPRARQATPMLNAIGQSSDPPQQPPADASAASASLLANMTSESGRQRRAAARKVGTYQLPNLHAKLRRE